MKTAQLRPASGWAPVVPVPAGQRELSCGWTSPSGCLCPFSAQVFMDAMASVVLPPLPSGVSSLCRWSRNTKQNLSELLTPFLCRVLRILFKYSIFVLNVSNHDLENLSRENWLAPSIFPSDTPASVFSSCSSTHDLKQKNLLFKWRHKILAVS